MDLKESRNTPMKWAAAAALLYGLATWAAAATGYWKTGSPVALALGGLAGLALLFCARRLAGGTMAAGFVAGGIAMLLGLYFGYGFISTGSFVPGGAMLLTSFAALFVILIGVFVQLAGQK